MSYPPLTKTTVIIVAEAQRLSIWIPKSCQYHLGTCSKWKIVWPQTSTRSNTHSRGKIFRDSLSVILLAKVWETFLLYTLESTTSQCKLEWWEQQILLYECCSLCNLFPTHISYKTPALFIRYYFLLETTTVTNTNREDFIIMH